MVTRPVLGDELWLTQISLSKTVCHVCFEMNYDVLKSKGPCILLNKHINFNKNETESKMENPTQGLSGTILVLQLIWEWQIKGKTVMSWSSRKKKEGILSTIHFVRRKFFFTYMIYLNASCFKYTFRIYTLLHTKRHLLHTLFCLLIKSS